MGEWEGDGGRRGWVVNRRKVKTTIQTQREVLCLQCVAQTDIIRKGSQDWCKEQPSTPCSPINATQDHEMHPRGFTTSIKSHL